MRDWEHRNQREWSMLFTINSGEVFSPDRHHAKFNKVRIIRRIRGKYWLFVGKRFLAQCLDFTTLFSVGDKKTVGQSGDIGVTSGGYICGWTADVIVKER